MMITCLIGLAVAADRGELPGGSAWAALPNTSDDRIKDTDDTIMDGRPPLTRWCIHPSCNEMQSFGQSLARSGSLVRRDVTGVNVLWILLRVHSASREHQHPNPYPGVATRLTRYRTSRAYIGDQTA